MNSRGIIRFLMNFFAVSGIPLLILIALAGMMHLFDEIRFRSWRSSLEKSGVMDVAEDRIRFLEVQKENLGQYPCELPEDKQDPRIRYRRTSDGFFIFIPREGSGAAGLIYLEKEWRLCTPFMECPPDLIARECVS